MNVQRQRPCIFVGLTFALVGVQLLWWPGIANLWLPTDLVARNLASQAMDWAAALFLVGMVVVCERENLASLGFRKFDAETFAAGMGLGAFFMIGSILFMFLWNALCPQPSVAGEGVDPASLPFHFVYWYPLLALVTAAVAEEIIFRGYALERLLRLNVHPILAITLVQIAFALYHLKDGLFSVVNVTLIGVIFSIYYARYRNLTMTIVAHALVDALAIVGYIAGIG